MDQENIIIVHLIGGLGNQMFQYAAGLSFAKHNNALLKLDATDFERYELHKYSIDNFNISAKLANNLEINALKSRKLFFLNNREFKEEGFNFNPKLLEQKAPLYMKGYWQSEKYFANIRQILLNEFVPKYPISIYSQGILELIKNADCPVALHVRRGDYLLVKNQQIHGVCSLDYYSAAISQIEKDFSQSKFFVFSDDIEWAKNNLIFNSSVVWVDGNNSSRNFEDIYLMSCCFHNIIANSSFSWWGAWLNNYARKRVIAPKSWFQTDRHNISDLHCPEWILL